MYKLVDESAAYMYIPNEYRSAVNGTHSTMCKFASRSDRSFVEISDNIIYVLMTFRRKEDGGFAAEGGNITTTENTVTANMHFSSRPGMYGDLLRDRPL